MKSIVVYDRDSGHIKHQCTVTDDTVDLYTEGGKLDYIEHAAVSGANHYIAGEFVSVINKATLSELLDEIRYKRGLLLSGSDWTQMLDVPLSEEQKQQWAVYRQDLRDFPEVCDPDNPVWPVPPS